MSKSLGVSPLCAAAFLALNIASARGQSTPAVKWVDPAASPPEAYAPLPPKEPPPSAASEPPAQTTPAEAAVPETPPEPQQGSSRPPIRPAAPHPRRPNTPVRLTPETGVKPSAPDLSPLNTRAANFINAYWANVGGTSDQVLPYLGSIYAPVVNYYGKPTSREAVLEDKYAFISRWPMRQTWAAPGAAAPQISCTEAFAECEITGVRDFDAVSPERGVRSSGTVRYNYRIRFVGGQGQIVAEDSQVLARE